MLLEASAPLPDLRSRRPPLPNRRVGSGVIHRTSTWARDLDPRRSPRSFLDSGGLDPPPASKSDLPIHSPPGRRPRELLRVDCVSMRIRVLLAQMAPMLQDIV